MLSSNNEQITGGDSLKKKKNQKGWGMVSYRSNRECYSFFGIKSKSICKYEMFICSTVIIKATKEDNPVDHTCPQSIVGAK